MTDERDPFIVTSEVLTPEEVAEVRRLVAEARDDPGDPYAAPRPTSPEIRLPAQAVPGSPPPPLPAPDPLWSATELLADGSSEYIDPVLEEYIDPVLQDRLEGVVPWPSRLRATPPSGWAAATVLQAEGPMHEARRPTFALFQEDLRLRVTAQRLPEPSLNPHPVPVPLLSRLRMLHARSSPEEVGFPLSAEWSQLDGHPAVLDRLVTRTDGRLAGFSLAAELAPDEGLVVLGSATPARHRALNDVGVPLAGLVTCDGPGLNWVLPNGWIGLENLELTTDTARAQVRLEPVTEGTGLESWTQVVFSRAPFLRDMRVIDDRMIMVRGVGHARLQRFDWQPSGRPRWLSTVVSGVVGEAGFSFIVEGPLELDETIPVVDPLEILATIEVLPPDHGGSESSPRPSVSPRQGQPQECPLHVTRANRSTHDRNRR